MKGSEFIKTKRIERGLSLRALGDMSGVSYVHIKKMEDGVHQPSYQKLVLLLHAMGISMYTFLKATEYKAPGGKECRRGDLNPHEVESSETSQPVTV